jgi:hypothetical protein
MWIAVSFRLFVVCIVRRRRSNISPGLVARHLQIGELLRISMLGLFFFG